MNLAEIKYRLLWQWMEKSEPVWSTSRGLIAEDEWGGLYLPSKSRPDWWDRPVNLKNPTHWPVYLRSRITKTYVMVESP